MLPTFVTYPRISNRPDRVSAEGVDDPAVEWVVTHKVDGTNMSVIVTTDGGVHFARRNGLLGADRTFFGYGDVLPSYAPWADVLKLVPTAPSSQVTLYGEFFGKGVQKSITYCPDKRFMGFDIAVDGTFLDVDVANGIFDRLGVPRAEVVFRGTRRQALQWASEHKEDDVCPAWFGAGAGGMALIPGNTGEGWVVRPVIDAHMDDGDRFIFKVKSSKFLEAPVKAQPAAPIEPADHPFMAYLTPARVSSVTSKLHPDEVVLKNMTALISHVIDDATVDALADGLDVTVPFKALAKHVSSLIKAHISSQ